MRRAYRIPPKRQTGKRSDVDPSFSQGLCAVPAPARGGVLDGGIAR